MAGFLYALLQKGKMFRNFHTSGAGALMALLTIAPKNTTPEKALARWATVGVADEIYRWLPINFKVFSKPGPFAPIFHQWAERFKRTDDPLPPANTPEGRRQRRYREWTDFFFEMSERDPDRELRRREFNDLVDLTFSAITPSTLNHKSQGLAAPLPFLEDLVDFSRFRSPGRLRRAFHGRLFVNAYCITDQEMDIFENHQIDAQHVRAALSLPFLYPPARIGRKLYLEGAAHEPLNFKGLVDQLQVQRSLTPRPLVVLDIMGRHPEYLIREPRDLWDAYVISIVTPIVALAKKDFALFQTRHNRRRADGRLFDVKPITFGIRKGHYPKVLDWSYSNLQYLFQRGIKAGESFCATSFGARVPSKVDILRRS